MSSTSSCRRRIPAPYLLVGHSLPVTVLTGGSRSRERWYPTWVAMQDELVRRLSPSTAHVVASRTGLHVHLDNPELVVRVSRQQLMQLEPRAR